MRAPVRVLVLCTGNSARSQMAEALLNVRGKGRVVAESAGSQPANRVNPLALLALQEIGVEWPARAPRGLDAIADQPWDIVVTVCDNAREACPLFSGGTMVAHWGQPDPAMVSGGETERLEAFRHARALLAWRVDRLLELDLLAGDPAVIQEGLLRIGVWSPAYPHDTT